MEYTIFFSLRNGLSADEQTAFLGRIRQWSDVTAVGRLYPKATDPNSVRKYFLYLRSGAKAETLIRRLKRYSNVESASVPAVRYAAAI
jgi:hypothetical protein